MIRCLIEMSRAALCATLAIGTCLLMASATAQEATLGITHSKGETQIVASPQSTVVLDMAAVDIMHLLGERPAAVPDGDLPPWLVDFATGLPRIDPANPDASALKRLRPDLIIVGAEASDRYAALMVMAPTIDLTPEPGDIVQSVSRNIVTLGSIFNKQVEAELLVTRLNDALTKLKERSRHAGKAVVLLLNKDRIQAYGPGSRYGALYDAFGFESAVEGLQGMAEGKAVSAGFLERMRPDWIFVIDADGQGREPTPAIRALAQDADVMATPAGKEGHVVTLDPRNWYGLNNASPTALMDTIKALTDTLDR